MEAIFQLDGLLKGTLETVFAGLLGRRSVLTACFACALTTLSFLRGTSLLVELNAVRVAISDVDIVSALYL